MTLVVFDAGDEQLLLNILQLFRCLGLFTGIFYLLINANFNMYVVLSELLTSIYILRILYTWIDKLFRGIITRLQI